MELTLTNYSKMLSTTDRTSTTISNYWIYDDLWNQPYITLAGINYQSYLLNNDGIKIEITLPIVSLSNEDLSINIDNKELTITSEKPGYYGKINERIPLSTYNLDLSTAKASLNLGLLTIEIELKKESQIRKLEVK